eukprot:TRINITY_DN1423_c0_g1_i5.p1 TRINITY_DN1423_c0_g1~~TRINITY_DN1423_c0_g1_i5.p1  ORF type:complete len:159 (-),score=13.71 TRINITY_DN1423_c0_g1_i5:372-848(-)
MLRFVWKRHQKSPAKNFSVVRYKHDLYSGWTTASYWDSFYQEKVDSKRLKKNNFEWFVSKVDCLVDHLLPHLPTSGNILHIGCGTSELGIRLYQRGFRNIHGIDISATAVEEMKRQCVEMPGMLHSVMDVTKLPFPPLTYDVVLVCVIGKTCLPFLIF